MKNSYTKTNWREAQRYAPDRLTRRKARRGGVKSPRRVAAATSHKAGEARRYTPAELVAMR